ncbi:alkaline shock response membrane anchor protein AmaP [Amycolatopsis sp. NPDC059657]|uniref:alkaline shock response membrane anchor protein AmaP n=1 Tax=Amycolatopsis sp. NPDC059657 TaxID=3346899 RepID=UPI0036732588
MSSHNRPARLNRAVLALFGLVLIAGGGFAVATHFGKLTVIAPDATVLPAGTPSTWVYYVAAAAAIVAGLLMVRWLAAQLVRKPKASAWVFDQDRGRTELAAATACAPFAAEVGGYPGVHDVSAALAGNQESASLALVVTVEQDGDLTAIRRRLDEEGFPRLRQALDLEELPVRLEFRFSAKAGARAR